MEQTRFDLRFSVEARDGEQVDLAPVQPRLFDAATAESLLGSLVAVVGPRRASPESPSLRWW